MLFEGLKNIFMEVLGEPLKELEQRSDISDILVTIIT